MEDNEQKRKLIFERCLHFINLPIECNVADLACGAGWAGDMAKDLYDADVTYIDTHDRIPRDGKERKFKLENVLFQNYKDQDAIFVLGLLYHLTLQQQLLLKNSLKRIKFILDTHICNDPQDSASFDGIGDQILKIYQFEGIYRNFSISSKCSYIGVENLFKEDNPFVHTEKSLHQLFNNHKLIKVNQVSSNRYFYIGMPLKDYHHKSATN